MSDQGDEGQVPAPPGLEGKGELPPRPTVRESFRRGLFVRLPTEGETNEGGPEQNTPERPVEDASYPDQARVEQYPEQVADPYPGWRQAPDGSWEAVSPEAQSYAEGYEPPAPETYPEIDQSANVASVAAGEPLTRQETDTEATSPFTFRQPATETAGGVSAGSEEAPFAAIPPPPEATPEVASGTEVVPDATPQVVATPEVATESLPTPEPAPTAAMEFVPVVEPAPEIAPVAEVTPEVAAPGTELVPEATPPAEDPVAGAELYIPSDVELLEGDMPLYGDKEKVPPRFAGEGLGEPIFVEFEHLPQTLVGLRRLLPKGTRLTYNFDHERAWVRSSVDVDLLSFAERVEALAAEGEEASV